VMIHDSLPAGFDFLAAPPQCTNDNGAITCDIDTIAAGDSASVAIKVRTTAALAGKTVSNLATVSSDDEDPNTANNQASATISVKPLVDLRLTKVATNPTPAANSDVSYTLTLLNRGPSSATGVIITDELPGALSFVSSAGQGSCGAAQQTVTCHLGTVTPGAAAVVVITTRVAASATGASVENTAVASADEPVARPGLLSSKALIVPRAVSPSPVPAADLSLAKKASRRTAHPGEAIGYTITVTNHGPATAAAPTVIDSFSRRVKLVSAHVPRGTCSRHVPVTCHLASLAAGRSAAITVVARPTSIGELRNAAVVSSPTFDPNVHNDDAHAAVRVEPGRASLSIAKTAGRRTVRPGQTVPYTITVRSNGPAPALGVRVCDRLGSGMTFVSVDGAASRHGTPCWTIRSLARGKQRRYRVTAQAPMAGGPRRLINTATASAQRVPTRTARVAVRLVGAPPSPPPPPIVTG